MKYHYDRVRPSKPAHRDDGTATPDAMASPPTLLATTGFLDGHGSPQEFEQARCSPPETAGKRQTVGAGERSS